MFLEGKNRDLLDNYADKMDAASAALKFERAAIYRDQIAHLQRMQEQQYVMNDAGDIDIVAAVYNPGSVCVLVLSLIHI